MTNVLSGSCCLMMPQLLTHLAPLLDYCTKFLVLRCWRKITKTDRFLLHLMLRCGACLDSVTGLRCVMSMEFCMLSVCAFVKSLTVIQMQCLHPEMFFCTSTHCTQQTGTFFSDSDLLIVIFFALSCCNLPMLVTLPVRNCLPPPLFVDLIMWLCSFSLGQTDGFYRHLMLYF